MQKIKDLFVFSRIILLAPSAYALHVVEESFGFPQWVSENFSVIFTTARFRRNNVMFIMLSIIITCITYKVPRKILVFMFVSWFAGLYFHNALFHIGTTAYFKSFSPGLITSILIYIPLSCSFFYLASKEKYLNNFQIITGFIMGGIAHYAFIITDLTNWNLSAYLKF